ncbi:hypothetical protein ACR6A7_14350 [Pantoea sp. RRHST58]|uniref:hypothetical protein n=1 Tax=Pantoea sp. RRHST58 TaxID=3425183 RepID=UPI003DA04007
MSPFLSLLANGDSCLLSLSPKGDIYPDDKSAINTQGIDVLGFSDSRRGASGNGQSKAGWQPHEKESYLFFGTNFANINAWLILLFMIAPRRRQSS